ncbi:hypothetical protein IFR04_015384 [Cadophora malorum]|uniref:Uncharacterized protein n=1 Tax=Cadophora malorum TaxID=108018 RepID=A0A8H7W5D4_9HELO|nr:hypothetical protein IFR04_015384 [Cadophora malorum]
MKLVGPRPTRSGISQSHHKVVSVSITAAVVSHDNSNDESDRRIQRSMSTHHVDLPSLQYRPPRTERTNTTESSTTKDQSSYTRPVGPELVSIKQPSCTGLPPQWTVVHDRFIAYLATHAPLDRTGKVQRREESRERWRNDDITRLVMERFGELDGCIKVCMIENRLALLDQAGDNDYFKMPYGAYKYENWGWGV